MGLESNVCAVVVSTPLNAHSQHAVHKTRINVV
jgi:hypothetical protein